MNINEKWERLQKFKESLDSIIIETYEILKNNQEKRKKKEIVTESSNKNRLISNSEEKYK